MQVAEAFNLISRAIDAGKAAHGYLLCGDLRPHCEELTALILEKLFPGQIAQVRQRTHPDVVWLEGEGKRRSIHVDSMREELVIPMSSTAFSGGWKVGVIVGADRMESAAANAFLKTLEEPPAKTLFILQTDSPDAIMPTIVSRSQRIDLPLSEGVLEGEPFDDICQALQCGSKDTVFDRAIAGKALASVLSELKEEVAPEEVAIVRKQFYKTIESLMRRMMIKGHVPLYRAFRNIEAVEVAYRQSERSMNDEAVLCHMMDRISFK